MNKKEIISIFLRYIILILVALPGMYLFYLIFTPLTIYPVYIILKSFYPSMILQGNSLLINSSIISIIPACIAGSAYYLLLILNLATPMKLTLRLKSLSFLFGFFLLFNIIRLTIFIFLYFSNFDYFDIAHKLAWYFGSTLFVIILWFANAIFFNIKKIPAYADLKSLHNLYIKSKKNKK